MYTADDILRGDLYVLRALSGGQRAAKIEQIICLLTKEFAITNEEMGNNGLFECKRLINDLNKEMEDYFYCG